MRKLEAKHKKRLRAWVKALRSGKYFQTRGALRGRNYDYETDTIREGNCCLGVACDVYRKEAKKGRWIEGGFRLPDRISGSDLPDPVARWFGFIDEEGNPVHNPKLSHTNCIRANDTHRYTFEQIAALIEQEYINTSDGK